MKHKRFTFLNQNGFAPSLVLLALAVITLIALIGVYVYQRQQEDKPMSVTQQSTPSDSTKKQAQADTAATQDLKIPELGIVLPVSSDLKGVSYTLSSNDGSTVGLTTAAFLNAGTRCIAANELVATFSIVYVVKRAGQYTPAQADELPFETFAKQFDGFYLTTGVSDGGLGSICDDNKASELAAFRAAYDAAYPQLVAAVKNAKTL